MENELFEVDMNADVEGLDILSTSILVGTKTWISRLDPDDVANECWFEALFQLLKQFNRYDYESRANFIPLY